MSAHEVPLYVVSAVARDLMADHALDCEDCRDAEEAVRAVIAELARQGYEVRKSS